MLTGCESASGYLPLLHQLPWHDSQKALGTRTLLSTHGEGNDGRREEAVLAAGGSVSRAITAKSAMVVAAPLALLAWVCAYLL